MPSNGPDPDSEPPPPPLNHVLRPHHLGLLAVILLAYRRNAQPSPAFMLHIQQVLIEEIAEVTVPRPYHELVRDLTTKYSSTSPEVLSLEKAIGMVPKHLNGVDALHDFFADIQNMVMEKDEEATPLSAVFERRSFFGLFCRRCCVSYNKLAFAGIDRLQQDFVRWAQGIDPHSGYNIQETTRKDNGHLLFPTAADEKNYGNASSFEAFQSASAEGDMSQAVNHLRLFFDQHFSDTNESGLRQHALLNLAHFHYVNREYVTARKYLFEAITVARTSSDKVTLQLCMSLLRRFTPHEGSNTLPLTEIHPDTSASDVVSDVIKLIAQTQEPIISSFSRILQALGCYDSAVSSKGGPPPKHEQWAIHAVQSFVWKIAGPDSLSEPEENIILSFTEPRSADEARWDAFRSRAERLSRQGCRDEALEVLFDASCWSGLSLRQYNEWACVVWRVLVLQVIRRGQMRHFHEFLRDQMPNMRIDMYDIFTKTLPPLKNQHLSSLLDRDAILHAKHHYKAKNTLAAIQPVLRGLFAAEFRGHWPIYRIGVVLLADLALDLGMRKYGRRILEEIMPQIMSGGDIEVRAFACYILSRCIVASSNGQANVILQAIPFLQVAEEDYITLEMLSCQQDVLYFLASVYNTLGMEVERDAAAARHGNSVEKARRWTKTEIPVEMKEIWSIVSEVGAKIAAGVEVRATF
ncbi:hypothetical protein K439DRAFT_1403628 [Ramaria rubella]|nr:hypothetical protein K439DRAFT_1403628 [Ramaria rubella]